MFTSCLGTVTLWEVFVFICAVVGGVCFVFVVVAYALYAIEKFVVFVESR
jgi:hypothetical protein